MAIFDTLDEFQGETGFFIKVFFINQKLNGNFWQVAKNSIEDGLKTGLEKIYNGKTAPFIVRQDFQQKEKLGHPNPFTKNMIADQEPARKGDFIAVGGDNKSGDGWVVAKITDKQTQQDIRDGKIKFVSPSIESLVEKNGVDLKWRVNHLAGVNDPAYGNAAMITGSCFGKPGECLVHLSKQAACNCKNNKNNSKNDNVSFIEKSQKANRMDKEENLEAKLKSANEEIEQLKKDNKNSIKNSTKNSNENEELKKKSDEQASKIAELEKDKETRDTNEKHELASKIAEEMVNFDEIKEGQKQAEIEKMEKQDIASLHALQAGLRIASKQLVAKQASSNASNIRYRTEQFNLVPENKQAAEQTTQFLKSYRSGIYN